MQRSPRKSGVINHNAKVPAAVRFRPDVDVTPARAGRAITASTRTSWRALVSSSLSAPDAVWSSILLCACLALYLKTCAPGLYSLDAAEFTIAAAKWGIPHATGYPLFVLLGHLFIQVLPVGDAAYRMTVMTAMFAALVPAALFVALRTLRAQVFPAFLACACFGVSYYQWTSAAVTKEHSLRDLLLALSLLLLLRWQRSGESRWLLLGAFAAALNVSNHMSAALYLPLLTLWAVTSGSLRPRQLAGMVGAGAAGLLPYAYLPLAYAGRPAFNIAGTYDAAGQFQAVDLASLPGFLWLVTGRQFGGQMLATPMQELPSHLAELGSWWWANFFGAGVILAIFGVRAFWRRNRRFACLTLALALAHMAFFVSYAVPDRDSMFVPVYLLTVFPLAFGVASALALLRHPGARALARVAGVAAIVAAASVNYRIVDVSHDDRPGRWAAHFLEQLPPNTVVIARWVTAGPLQYLIQVEGIRPDVRVIDRFLVSDEALAAFINDRVGREPIAVDADNLLPVGRLRTGIVLLPLSDTPTELLDRSGANVFPGYLISEEPSQ
jgi:hypothetical protein